MEKKVEVLVLELFMRVQDSYVFPVKLLGLENGHNIGFESLRVLHFEGVDVSEEVFDYLLSNCPVLERLSLAHTKSLVNVRVANPSIPLKHLSIRYCFLIARIEIIDTNLVSLTYQGLKVDLILKNVPSLVEVSIVEYALGESIVEYVHGPLANMDIVIFKQLSCCLSQLETLMLDIHGVHDIIDFKPPRYSFSVFPNLKHLELVILADYQGGLNQLASFVNASPHLHTLVLKLKFSQPTTLGGLKFGVERQHRNLRVVKIEGYRGRTNAVRHIRYLIKNAVAQEKLVVDPVRRWFFHHTGADKRVEEVKEEAEARDHAMQKLKPTLPSTIQFVCL